MLRRSVLSVLIVCGLALIFVSSGSADNPAPGYEVIGRFAPTNLPPGGEGFLHLYVYNLGAGESAVGPTLTNVLPAGVVAKTAEISGGGVCTGTSVVTCQMTPVGPSGSPVNVEIPVSVSANPGSEPDRVSLSGAGSLDVTNTVIPVHYGMEPASFGLANADVWITNPDGTIDTQAGSHPYELTVAWDPTSTGVGQGGEKPSNGDPRYLNVSVPPGVVGEPGAVPKCTRSQFENDGECPPDTQIGEDATVPSGNEGSGLFQFAVYNMVPPPGVAAEFAFTLNGNINVFIDARIRSGGDYGITEHANVPQRKIVFNTTTIWGTPGEHPAFHEEDLAERAKSVGLKPLLTLPTACGGPGHKPGEIKFGLEEVGTWQNESVNSEPFSVPLHNSEGNPVGITGCEKLKHFQPFISLAPDTSFSDTPAGLSTTVKVPQGLNPEGLATPGLKETTVVLPEGVAINPGQATGLAACQPWQENIGGPEAEKETMDGPPSCPAASKVGTDEISTPLLPGRLKGNVYILQSNPPNLQLLVAAEGEGVFLKLIGNVHLNEQTGQITTIFKGTPQDPGTPDAPLNEFVLNFSGGAQAALVTPQFCGVYTATADFTPWSSPLTADALSESNFQITAGPGGSSASNCTGPLPFTPTMTAGATTDQAAGYTDFTMLLSRNDGQQHIEKLQFKTPEGLLGMIAKVPLCGEPQAAQGTCSAASQIGHTVAEVGPGPYPFVLPEPGAPPAPIYLTGPYEDAPFGLSIAVPIVAGPFNLGTEVVRAKIEVDPHTSQLTISTTAFPKTVKGISTDIREIDAVIDRPEFMFNPTSCNPMSFSGTAYSFEGATAPVSSHFQMGSCRSLAFKPNFSVSTSGKTSRASGASLTAKIVYPTGNLGANQASSQSNIASVKVDLPKQLPSRLTTLQKACSAKVFEANPANCPPASIVGHAKAITPVLPVPIEGPTYFVSHAGEEFPSLIAVLQGYGVTVDLVGSTFINNKTNITSSTFKNVPDVPIASFELSLPQGKYSALAANGNLCKEKLAMPTAFTGQDGAVIHQSTPISVTGCAKAKPKNAKKSKKSGKGHKAKKK